MSLITPPVWIAPSQPIEGETIRLLPLTAGDIDTLTQVGSNSSIWTYFPVDLSDREKHAHYLYKMIEMMQASACFAFVIEEKISGRIAGMTRLFNLFPNNRQCEVGSWLHPEYWSAGINREAKKLLLGYCFEVLQTIRVQFRTDTRNIRSKMALEKMGAKYEGVLRAERILENGHTRDAAFYSILKGEWPEVRDNLMRKVAKEVIPAAAQLPAGIAFLSLPPFQLRGSNDMILKAC